MAPGSGAIVYGASAIRQKIRDNESWVDKRTRPGVWCALRKSATVDAAL